MNRIPILLILLSSLLATAGAQMVASNDRVRIEARANTESERKEISGTTADQVTQFKTIALRLSGKARSPETRVVRWKIFGRNVDNGKITTVESGEFKLDLDARGEQSAETKRATMTYTPDHSLVKRGGKGKNKTSRATKVEGKGVKYAGYSVQVVDGNTVVGEFADPQGIGASKP
jgi:hypothetical protein